MQAETEPGASSTKVVTIDGVTSKRQQKASACSDDVRSGIRRLERQLDAVLRTVAIPAVLRSADVTFTGRRFGLNSQFAEDGILLALHEEIGAQTRQFVELGCGDNGGNSGTLAAELGWHGLMIDASESAVAATRELNPMTITGVVKWITRDNVNALIETNGFGGEVDQLSIDLDGNDYWILESLAACKPRLLILEYNSAFGPHIKATVPYKKDFSVTKDTRHGHLYFGASISALTQLAGERGYGLVAVEPTGANAFFLADGLAPQIRRCEPAELYRTLPGHREAVANKSLLKEMAADGLNLVKVGRTTRSRRAGTSRRPSAPIRARERFFDVDARAHAALVGIETDSGSYVMSTQDLNVGRSLFIRRKRGEMRLLENALMALDRAGISRGGAFVDCGANIGTTVIPALLGGAFSSGICFEPHPFNFRLLKANLALNDLDDRATPVRAAVSCESGALELVVHPTNSGGHEIAVATESRSREMPAGDLEQITVDVVTIDEALAERSVAAEDVGMLWLDVQGHEGAALQGAENVLESVPPVVFEFYPAMLERAGDLDVLLATAERVFSHVVDLRLIADHDSDPAWRPISDLRGIADGRRLTDVLIARL